MIFQLINAALLSITEIFCKTRKFQKFDVLFCLNRIGIRIGILHGLRPEIAPLK